MRKPLALLTVLALAACATPSAPQYPPITFYAKPQIRLDVAHVDIGPGQPPAPSPQDVSYLFPDKPFEAAQRWALNRLKAAGDTGGEAHYVVDDASATVEPIATKGGLTGAFTDQQSRRYNLHIAVHLDVVSGSGGRTGTIRAEVSRSTTAAQSATEDERQRLLYNMLDGAMSELDRQLDAQIHQQLAAFLVR